MNKKHQEVHKALSFNHTFTTSFAGSVHNDEVWYLESRRPFIIENTHKFHLDTSHLFMDFKQTCFTPAKVELFRASNNFGNTQQISSKYAECRSELHGVMLCEGGATFSKSYWKWSHGNRHVHQILTDDIDYIKPQSHTWNRERSSKFSRTKDLMDEETEDSRRN